MNDLIHPVLVAFKDSLDGAVPAVLHPTFQSKPGSRLLSVMAEEDSLDPSFDDDPHSDLFHLDLADRCLAGPL